MARTLLLILFGLLDVLALSAQEAWVPNAFSGTVSVIDTGSRTVVATIPVGQQPSAVAVSPDGHRIYVPNLDDGNVSILDAATRSVIATLATGLAPQGVTVSPDNSEVYVSNLNSNTLSVVDAEALLQTATIPVGVMPASVVVSPDGARVYVANYGGGSLSVVDTSSRSVIATVDLGGLMPFSLTISPTGDRVFATHMVENLVSIIDTGTDSVLATVPVPGGPTGLVADRQSLFVSDFHNHAVTVVDLDNEIVVATWSTGAGSFPVGVDLTPDGRFLYVALSGLAAVTVLDTTDGSLVDTIPVGSRPLALGEFMGPAPAVVEVPTLSWIGAVSLGLVLIALGTLRVGRGR